MTRRGIPSPPPRPRLWLLPYSVLIELVVWTVLVPVLLMRILVGRAEPGEVADRLGWPTRSAPADPASGRPTVIVHAVSAGEMHAAAPLVAELVARGRDVMLTTGTAAGLAAARSLTVEITGVRACRYLPWDRAHVGRWLRRLGPSAVVVIETEIWPNLFAACHAHHVPVMMASGRIRPRDLPRYRIARSFFRRVLSCVTWIGVQSPREREAFLAIGAPAERVEVAGNLKFDAAARATVPGAVLSPDRRRRTVLVAGSTHAPEESWLLACLRVLADQGDPIRLVLAPRHVQRAAHLARLARRRGFDVICWSEGRHARPGHSWDVMVLDRFGELRALYHEADIVFIGGTLAPIGGHNVLEAAAASRPIIVGPHTAEVDSVVQPLADAGGLLRISDNEPVSALVEACRCLRDRPGDAEAIGRIAADVCRAGTGSAARHAQAIVRYVMPR